MSSYILSLTVYIKTKIQSEHKYFMLVFNVLSNVLMLVTDILDICFKYMEFNNIDMKSAVGSSLCLVEFNVSGHLKGR